MSIKVQPQACQTGGSPFVVVESKEVAVEACPKRDVYVYVNVFSITEISTTSQVFNAYFFLRATWVEPLLRSAEEFQPDAAWTPRFQFMNAVETPDVQEEQTEVLRWRQGPQGNPVVSWSAKCRGTFREHFELGLFPFDAQDLHLTISSQQKNTWIHEDCFDGVKSKLRKTYIVLPEFKVDGPALKPREELALGKFATLDIVFTAHRRFTFHLWNVFFPVFLLTAMQFAVFAVDVADVADRLSVTLTLVLASVAYKYVVSQNLPNISYLTVCDLYVVGSFVFMAAVVLENAICGYSAQADKEVAELHDQRSFRAFLGVFVAGHVLYLTAVLLALRKARHSAPAV